MGADRDELTVHEDDVRAVYVQRGLSDYQSAVDGRFRYLPYDVVVPGVLTTGDLCDLAGSLAPRPLRIENLVDGLNREERNSDPTFRELKNEGHYFSRELMGLFHKTFHLSHPIHMAVTF